MMVTVFGVAVGPMMLPLLGGLVFPQLTRRGAMVGFVVGLIVGFTTLGIQRYYLPTVAGLNPNWITFEFGAYAIFINVGVTILAMVLWSRFEEKDAQEVEKIRAFFARLSVPIGEARELEAGRRAPSPFFITGLAVLGIGLMLLLVSFLSESATARWINVAAGLVLAACGWLLYRTKQRIW
jgi:hypothetical protein